MDRKLVVRLIRPPQEDDPLVRGAGARTMARHSILLFERTQALPGGTRTSGGLAVL